MEKVNELLQELERFPVYKQQGWVRSDENAIPYFGLMLLFVATVFFFEFYLDSRQLYRFRNAKKMPKEIEGVIPEDKFKKSISYGSDKLSFGRIESSFMFVESLALLLAGWLPFAWDFSTNLALKTGYAGDEGTLWHEFMITSIFVCLLIVHDTVVSLPFGLYSTFVVEERHGFNKTTLALYFRDKLVALALSLVIGLPVLGAVIGLVRWGGPYFYVYVWAFLCVMSIFLMTIYPTFIAPLFNTYKKLESGPIYTAIEELAKRVKFPLTQIYEVDGSRRSAHSNAYFYGFFKSKRIVLFDTLIKQVTLEELLAILGHEIGHWKLWHTIQGFVISQVYIFALFLVFSFVQNTPALYQAFGFVYVAPMPVLIALTLFTQTIWSPVDKVLTLLMNINSRRNEFAADKFAKDLGMGEELGSGLIKISIENLGNMVPDSLYSTYHFSHPPLVERLRAIQKPKSQ